MAIRIMSKMRYEHGSGGAVIVAPTTLTQADGRTATDIDTHHVLGCHLVVVATNFYAGLGLDLETDPVTLTFEFHAVDPAQATYDYHVLPDQNIGEEGIYVCKVYPGAAPVSHMTASDRVPPLTRVYLTVTGSADDAAVDVSVGMNYFTR